MLALQTATAQINFSVGPRVGANFAKLTGDDIDNQANTRFVAGLTSTYSINVNSGVSVDVLYSGEGTETGGSGSNLAMNYLRVPITYNYFFRDWEDNFRPKLYLGLAPGFLLSAEQNERDVKENFNSFDLAGVLGLGFNYRLSERGIWFNTDLRYVRGLTDVTESEGTQRYNQHWQPSIGVSFGLDE